MAKDGTKKMNRNQVMFFYLVLIILFSVIGFVITMNIKKKNPPNPLIGSAVGAAIASLVSVGLYAANKGKIAAY